MGLAVSARKNQRGIGIVPILIIVAVLVAAVLFLTMGRKKEGTGDVATTASGSVSSSSSSSVKTSSQFAAPESLAAILPQQTVAFYVAQDAEKTYRSLTASNFWKKMSALPFWADLKLEDSFKTFKQDVEKGLGFELTEDRVFELIGKEFAVAVLPPESAADATPQVLFLLRTGMKAKIVDSIARLVESRKSDPRLSKTTYNGTDIVLIKPEKPQDPEVRYFFGGDVLTLGVGKTENTFKAMIDIGGGKKALSLAADKNYNDLGAMLGTEKGVIGRFFVDMQKVVNSLGALGGAGVAGMQKELASTLGALRMIGGVVALDKDITARVLVVPNRTGMDPAVAALWDLKPAENPSLKMIPTGSLVVSASNSLEVGKLWDSWRKSLAENPAAKDQAAVVTAGLQTMEKDYGINIEKDVLSWIGSEVAFVFSDIDVTGMFPVPRLSLIVKVTDEAKAGALMTKLIEILNKNLGESAGGVKVELVDHPYGGVSMKVIQIPVMVPGLMPGFAFINGYLVISSSAAVMEAMVDTNKGTKDSLLKDAQFQRLKSVFPDKTNQIAYMNVEGFFTSLVDVLRWVVQYQNSQAPTAPAQPGAAAPAPAAANPQVAVLQNQVIPFIEGLKAIKGMGLSTVYSKDGIEQKIRISIEDK